MTADEFLARYGDESAHELVEGELVEVPGTGARKGEICATAAWLIGSFIVTNRLGRVFLNDTFIRIDAETVLGADLIFASHASLPAETPTPVGALAPPLDAVVEVRSPSSSWTTTYKKVGLYLAAGVTAVLVLDPDGMTASVYRASGQVIHHTGDLLDLADVLPGFTLPVARLFE